MNERQEATRRCSALLEGVSAKIVNIPRLGTHERGQALLRSLDFFGGQPNLHHLLAVFLSLLFGKIDVPENVQHTLVLALYKRVEGANSVTSRFFDQPIGQACPYRLALPPILDERRVLGSLGTRCAGLAHGAGANAPNLTFPPYRDELPLFKRCQEVAFS